MAHFIPCCETKIAQETANLLIKFVFCRHGLPLEVISDRGPQFKSQFWKSLPESLGIKRKLSTAFHPQTNGLTERTNQTLEKYLRCFANENQDNWVDILPLAEFSFNNSKATSTQFSPFQANYGFHPRFNFLRETEDRNPSSEQTLKTLQEVHEQLRVNLANSKNKMKVRHLGGKKPKFLINSYVWLLRKKS